jgi:polyisoprenoid-binding protein YceI
VLSDFLGGVGVAGWIGVALAGQLANPIPLAVDNADSRVEIRVGKAGLLGFAGHPHEVLAPIASGRIAFDPATWERSSVVLAFDAASLRVTGKGEPAADVPEVQRVMLSERVLDAQRFPSIVFRSRRVAVTPRQAGAASIVIEGDLALRGTTRPVTVRGDATVDRSGVLTVRGGLTIRQTDFGIEPVVAAGGTVRVRDALEVQFALTARPEDRPRPR